MESINNYQKYLIDLFKDFRKEPKYPVYPPYHKGYYLEDYFFNWFIENKINLDRYYIPVFWTSCYLDNNRNKLQELLNSLDQEKKYFTVSQYDDGVLENLPKDTIEFGAGGNKGDIPIPLICSPIENIILKEKDIFCSFIGSNTHQIRNNIYNILKNNSKYHIQIKGWSNKVNDNDYNNYIDITLRSKFALAPRGYGKTSFRLYEIFQLNSVPVYIYNDKWLPFEDEINWKEFCVLVHEKDINNIDNILNQYSDKDIEQMIIKGKEIWNEYFTMEGMSKNIIKNL